MRGAWRKRAGLLALAGLLVAGNLGFYLWYRATAQERREAAESRRLALTREVEVREAEAAKLAAQRNRLSQVSSAIEEFYGRRIGSRRDTLAAVVSDLHSTLQKTGIAPAQISYTTAPVPNLPLSEMRIAFSFRNDYLRFKQFVGAVESGTRWMVVKEIGLQRDNDLPGAVQVRIGLATYFAGEPSAPPRAASAAPASGTLTPASTGASPAGEARP
jgi:Tfp pilus assembly protein PilO